MESFTESCRQVYFSTEDPTLCLFIIVNSGLVPLFVESRLVATDPKMKAEYHAAWQTCSTNMEVAISSLPLVMPTTLQNAQALLLGASWAVDVSRPSLAWLLTTRAVHMLRALGLHQYSTMTNDSSQHRADKCLLFWSAYMLDKGLSLRLGRASTLQDYDIALPSSIPYAYAEFPGKETLDLWVRHARTQGQVYERLYSPEALTQPMAKRIQIVHELAADVHVMLAESNRLLEVLKDMAGYEKKQLRTYIQTLKSDEVSFYSTLALVYRALPPALPQQQQHQLALGTPGAVSRTFANECVDNARVAIRVHLEAMDIMDDAVLQVAHLHWYDEFPCVVDEKEG